MPPRPPDSTAPARENPGEPTTRSVQLRLSRSITAPLEKVAFVLNDDPGKLLHDLRPVIVGTLRTRLVEGSPLPDCPDYCDGLTLRANACLRARQQLDPLGFGDHVLRRRICPVLSTLVAEHVEGWKV